jgi:hypothetical protein
LSALSVDMDAAIWNGDWLTNQLDQSDLPVNLASDFWQRLHAIDNRFLANGTNHLTKKGHVPLNDVIPKLPQITDAVSDLIRQVETSPA